MGAGPTQRAARYPALSLRRGGVPRTLRAVDGVEMWAAPHSERWIALRTPRSADDDHDDVGAAARAAR